MTLEQEYFRSKLRLHNRMLHELGIVCGAKVEILKKPNADKVEEPVPWHVVIRPGYILGPYGDEIVIDCDRPFDLRSQSLIGVTGEPCVEEPDPWCSDVHDTRTNGDLFLAVRYKEVMTRPVRVQPTGCGCNDSACEYSRWRDGYEFKVLRGPRNFQEPADNPELCPPCPDDPWVLLAKITVDGDGNVGIDMSVARRPDTQSNARFVKEHKESLIILPSDPEAPEKSSEERILVAPASTPVKETIKKTPSIKKKSRG
jgi:hypothetical protein